MGVEDAARERRLRAVDLGEEGLQAPLPQVPLQDSEAQALPVEVAGQAGEAIGRSGARLERAGEREAAVREWLADDLGLDDRFARKQRRPGLGPHLAVDGETVRLLERFYGSERAAAEVGVNGTGVEAEVLQAGLELGDFRALGVELVEGHPMRRV